LLLPAPKVARNFCWRGYPAPDRRRLREYLLIPRENQRISTSRSMSAIGSNRSKSRAVRAPRPIACSKKLMSVLSATLGADRYSKVPSAAAAFRSTRRTSHRRYGLSISRCRSRSWKANSGAGTRRTTGCRNEPSGAPFIRGHLLSVMPCGQSKTLTYPDYICVVPLLHAAERAVSTGAVLNADNQFGVGKRSQGKRKVNPK
jgi:hypothetical protein